MGSTEKHSKAISELVDLSTGASEMIAFSVGDYMKRVPETELSYSFPKHPVMKRWWDSRGRSTVKHAPEQEGNEYRRRTPYTDLSFGNDCWQSTIEWLWRVIRTSVKFISGLWPCSWLVKFHFRPTSNAHSRCSSLLWFAWEYFSLEHSSALSKSAPKASCRT